MGDMKECLELFLNLSSNSTVVLDDLVTTYAIDLGPLLPTFSLAS